MQYWQRLHLHLRVIASTTTYTLPKWLSQYYHRRWYQLAVIKQLPRHISLQSSTVTPLSFWQQLHLKEDWIGWTRDLQNFAYAALIIATPFKSHILFKARALGSSLLQPKGDWVYLCFQYYSHWWNPPFGQLHNLLYFSPSQQSLTFYGPPPPPPPSRGSAIHVFLVINMFCVFLRAHFNPLLETG